MTDRHSRRAESQITGRRAAIDGRSRRRFLKGLGVGAVLSTAGCLERVSTGVGETVDLGDNPGEITGTVLDLHGSPITDATITAICEGTTPIADTVADERGEFQVACDRPAWIRVDAPGYLPRCVAADPTTASTVRLTPDDGTVSLTFGGDVMFGRRFYDPPPDSLSSRFKIDSDDRLASYRRLLRGIRPFLETADITSVNLETALTTTDWIHPNKRYKYTSHPIAAKALGEAGVDYAALGNNHVFDALGPGFRETVSALDAVGIDYSGAGHASDDAWEPAYVEQNGVTVAYLSCCTVVDTPPTGLGLNWSANRDTTEEYTVRQNGDVLTFSGSMGVAEPTVARLREHVTRAVDQADVVVVQIHGGDEYVRQPTARIRRLTEAASDAGADIVVNHHPHVTGGVEFRGSTLIAWTLGNLVFDQQLWSTLRSYALTVDVGRDGVERASVEPIVLDGYVPKGVVGETKTKILRESAGLSSNHFALSGRKLESVPESPPSTRTETVEFEGTPSIYAGTTAWVDKVLEVDGTVRLGRDRLLTGRFEDAFIDDQRAEGALWRYGRGTSPTIGQNFGREGSGGAKLSRHTDNVDPGVIAPDHRLPIFSDLFTISAAYRYYDSAGAELLVTWYDDTQGGSFASERYKLPNTRGEWRRFAYRLEAPPKATHLSFFVFVEPPEGTDIRELALDDVRLIEWADEIVTGGRQYDHLLVDGLATADLTMSSRDEHATFDWTELDT